MSNGWIVVSGPARHGPVMVATDCAVLEWSVEHSHKHFVIKRVRCAEPTQKTHTT